MEWLLLIVLVPLAIVPLVLLYGFAGCASFEAADPLVIPAPTDLTATAVSTSQINLAWKHASAAGGETFIVAARRSDDMKWNENYQDVPAGQFTAELKSLTEGLTYEFTVRAAIGTNESAPSPIATRRTFRWEVAYDNMLNESAAVAAGDTLVQRIDRTVLAYNDIAREIRLTLRATPENPPAPFLLTEVSVSHAAEPGDEPLIPSPEPYDSRFPIEKFGPVSLPGNGQPLTLPERKFLLDRNRDLLVAFDVSASNTTNSRRTVADVGTSRMYRRGNAAQATVGDRSGTYNTTPSPAVYLVQKIEVLTGEA